MPSRLPADTGSDAEALLAKHRAFVGWQLGDGTFRTLRIESESVTSRGKKPFTATQVREGLLYRTTDVDRARANLQRDYGFTGNIFWQSDENGFTTPMLGRLATNDLSRLLVFNEATAGLPATSRGTATVDGKTVDIVRVTEQNKQSIDLYVDPASGAYVQAVIDPDGGSMATLHILAYAEPLPGKKIISSYRWGDGGNTTTYTKIEPNVPVSSTDLHPPAPRAAWTFADPQPFAFKSTDKRFIVNAKVNGVSGTFIVDTGASGIYLSSSFAKRANVERLASSEASGIAGKAKTEVDRIASFEIGGNTLSNVVGYSIDDMVDRDAPDGAIGFSLFGGAIVSMDTDDGKMTIADPSQTSADTTTGVVLNVDLDDGIPSVPMKMNGTIDVNATLDTGDFYYVLFGNDLISHHGLKMLVDDSVSGVLESHPIVGGAGGYEEERCGHVDSLSLGPIVYQGPPACESPSFSGNDILVGYDYLRHFNYVFDYPHGRIVIIPRKEQ